MAGVNNCMSKVSLGQKNIMNLVRVMDAIRDEDSQYGQPDTLDKIKKSHYKDKKELSILLNPSFKGGPITMFLDEPTESFDMGNQLTFWNNIKKLSEKNIQIIIATHSPYSLAIEPDNLIEFEENYREMMRAAICGFFKGRQK
jgi:predicted ATPase